jgi:hypothetical protein
MTQISILVTIVADGGFWAVSGLSGRHETRTGPGQQMLAMLRHFGRSEVGWPVSCHGGRKVKIGGAY